MSRISLLIISFSLSIFTASAQQGAHVGITPIYNNKPETDTRLPCQKNPTIPSFNITLVDSVTIFNTSAIKEGKKTAFIIFGPDCPHCRDFIRQLYAGIDTLTNIDFYLVTPIRSYSAFYKFYYEFGIADHKNIKAAGRDLDFFAMDFFGVRQFPYVILYDEHKQYVSGFGPGNALTELHN